MSPPPAVAPASSQRFPLLSSNRYIFWLALLAAPLLAAFATQRWLRLLSFVFVVGLVGCAAVWRRYRPVLVVAPEGYAVESAGRRRFSVTWSAVRHVRHDPAERALYLDCGEPARNLLLPPLSGYAFSFARRDALYELLLSYVGDRAEVVARLDVADPSRPPASASLPAKQ